MMEYWTSVANAHSEYWLTPQQPVPAPTSEIVDALAAAYWESLEDALAGGVRAEGAVLGPIRLRVGRRGPTILAFDEAHVEIVEGGIELHFPIVSGFATSSPGGELRIVARTFGSSATIGVVVDGYRPRFEKLRVITFPVAAPYTVAQHFVHRWVTRRSLPRLAAVIG